MHTSKPQNTTTKYHETTLEPKNHYKDTCLGSEDRKQKSHTAAYENHTQDHTTSKQNLENPDKNMHNQSKTRKSEPKENNKPKENPKKDLRISSSPFICFSSDSGRTMLGTPCCRQTSAELAHDAQSQKRVDRWCFDGDGGFSQGVWMLPGCFCPRDLDGS